MANVPKFLDKIRDWVVFHKKEVIFALIIFLVASLSFGLGYLANREFNHTPIVIEKSGEQPVSP